MNRVAPERISLGDPMTAPTPERRMPHDTAIHMAEDEPRGKDGARREGGPRGALPAAPCPVGGAHGEGAGGGGLPPASQRLLGFVAFCFGSFPAAAK